MLDFLRQCFFGFLIWAFAITVWVEFCSYFAHDKYGIDSPRWKVIYSRGVFLLSIGVICWVIWRVL